MHTSGSGRAERERSAERIVDGIQRDQRSRRGGGWSKALDEPPVDRNNSVVNPRTGSTRAVECRDHGT